MNIPNPQSYLARLKTQGPQMAKLPDPKSVMQKLGQPMDNSRITSMIGVAKAIQPQVAPKVELRPRGAGAPVTPQDMSAGRAGPPTPVISQLLGKAQSLKGTPYVWGGTDPTKGLDCSGFTQYVFKQFGISMPRVSKDQARAGKPVSVNAMQPGDLLAFGLGKKGVHHVGIYLGNGKYIHSPKRGDVVKVSNLSGRKDLAAVRRYV